MIKVASGTTTVYIFSGSKVIAEYDNGAAPGSPSREYIYSGAALLAKIEGGASIYYHPDHLSNRVLTDSSGNTLGQRGHYPFGDTWYESGTTTKLQFTSYERDSESTNDYAMMRSYVNRFDRFSSPDPIGGSLSNPQSLNRYAYAVNEPIDLIDPTGLDTINLYYCMETENGPYVCIFSDAWGAITGLPLIVHPGPGGGGGGGGNAQTQTTAQKKAACQKQAQAKYSQSVAQAKQAFYKGVVVGTGGTLLVNGLAGCAIGAGVGGFLGGVATAFGGGEGAPPGAALGCGAAGLAAMFNGLPSAAIIGGGTGGLMYLSDLNEAKQQLQEDLQACGN